MAQAIGELLARIEADYLQFISKGVQDDHVVRPLLSDLSRLVDVVERDATLAVPAALRTHIWHLATRIQTVSRCLADLDHRNVRSCDSVRSQVREIIHAGDYNAKDSESDKGSLVEPDATFHPYRDYFLSHLGSPYPVGDDRDHLLSLVPSHDRTQLENWFSNARRRSGWTAYRRDFAFDSPIVLQNLLDNIDAPGKEEAKARLEGVKRYFDPEREMEVAEPLRELVQQGPTLATPPPPPAVTTRAEERVAKRASRGVGAESDTMRMPKSKQESWSSRRRQRNPSAAASSTFFNPDVDFYSNTTPMPLVEEPRYPSTFSSPTASLRSVSNASSSSLDSLISYGSSDYAPRIERMEAPPSCSYSTASAGPSSGYAFPAPNSHFAHPQAVETAPSRIPSSSFHGSTRSHPYFCTLNDLASSTNRTGLPPLGVFSSMR